MPTDLKSEILAALADTSSQRPMDTKAIIKKTRRQRDHVEAALLEMYQTQQIACCKIIKGGSEAVVWWISGNSMTALISFRTLPAKEASQTARKKYPSRMGEFSRNLLTHIGANPGLTTTEYCDQLNIQKQRDRGRAACAVYNLVKIGWLRSEGNNPGKRYFPEERAAQ